MNSLVRISEVCRVFHVHGRREPILALNGVSLEINAGEVLGLVGGSGSGKTTLGRLVAGHDTPTSGAIFFAGDEVGTLLRHRSREFRRRVQLIFQDPYESLDPRQRVEDILAEPLIIHGLWNSRPGGDVRIREILKRIDVPGGDEMLKKRPHELSGGLRQRVAIARAMILKPQFVVADEPVSMLDMSLRIGVLNLMRKFQREDNTTFLFVTHDLAVAKYICDRIAVIHDGRVVEIAETASLMARPSAAYTRELLAAAPRLCTQQLD